MSIPHYDTEAGEVYCEDCAPDNAQPGYFAEADTPQHCATCEELLDTNMTDEGMRYVQAAIRDFLKGGQGRGEIILEWAQRWFPDYVDQVKANMSGISDISKMGAEVGGVNTEIWNALSAALDALKQDMQHLPEDLLKQRQQTLEQIQKALEGGKEHMFRGYKHGSTKEDR